MDSKVLAKYLDEYFSLSAYPVKDPSQNGLQVESCVPVNFVASAVDACLETFQAAARAGAQFLIVHHGLFWGQSQLVSGMHGRRVRFLIQNELSLYAMHLPLDSHPESGNNILLAKALGLLDCEPFGGCGIAGRCSRAIDRAKFLGKVRRALSTHIECLLFGPDKIKRVAVVSGSGASEIPLAASKGIDLLLTGEGGHIHFHTAREHGINVVYGGHYATETFGVRAVGQHLSEKFDLRHTFIDFPTGF